MILVAQAAGKVGCADIKEPFFNYYLPKENENGAGQLSSAPYFVIRNITSLRTLRKRLRDIFASHQDRVRLWVVVFATVLPRRCSNRRIHE